MTRGDEVGSGLKRLNEALLRPGDIVLVTGTAIVSAAIRLATRSDVSHAMVYVEDRSVIDATDEGVQARNTQRLSFGDPCPVHVLRLRGGLSAERLDVVRTYLRERIGTRYSKREAVLAGLGGGRRWSRQQFCSRLVAQAFEAAGVRLVPDPNYCSPAELKASPSLEAVPDTTVALTAEEAAAWDTAEDTPRMMREATNALLRGARALDPGIETFGDLNAHLVANPGHDGEMCRLLATSGYLGVWAVERSQNPWQYDLASMDAAPPGIMAEYCWSTLANEDGGHNRHVVNRGAYLLLARRHGLGFFHEMTALHEHLAALHRLRLDVAARWLAARGLLREAEPVPLVPHCAEWFAALERWNPVQAEWTRRVVEAEGRTDVCSVCGDDPAGDYRIAEGHRPAGGVDAMRLCIDCLRIRRDAGEPFVAIRGYDDGDRPEDR